MQNTPEMVLQVYAFKHEALGVPLPAGCLPLHFLNSETLLIKHINSGDVSLIDVTSADNIIQPLTNNIRSVALLDAGRFIACSRNDEICVFDTRNANFPMSESETRIESKKSLENYSL